MIDNLISEGERKLERIERGVDSALTFGKYFFTPLIGFTSAYLFAPTIVRRLAREETRMQEEDLIQKTERHPTSAAVGAFIGGLTSVVGSVIGVEYLIDEIAKGNWRPVIITGVTMGSGALLSAGYELIRKVAIDNVEKGF
jgi:hypothetical protein